MKAMKISGLKWISALVVASAVAGCDTSQGIGRFFAGDVSDVGPDEFGIVPTKPLELPDDLVTLPEPTPGARNRTDLLPEHDAVAALGGKPERLDSTTVGAGEGALLAAGTRNGTTPEIRTVLAEEDADFRENNGPLFLQRLFKVNTYLKTYEGQTLKARNTNELMRRSNVKTPSVSPESER
ncbi:DUF3035 domain-containing protein [Roseobacter sp. N2S]|uniref:DUF3035 domain-containing protein n=1 Tax=Roseobacter sp. N2S TaxID=2663844 RepID=UPI002858C3D6|nr:DUF3035 domain-containing protein [Roseobacter sp. N2S]MDR6266149.1 putative small secreted protein [Roseobacter sp. N2S]